ncbi:MAG TPA: hypothetical protein VHB21_03650, partial [Minicystis sp.]|nr:hypothetical protein [Minicystis sp.]
MRELSPSLRVGLLGVVGLAALACGGGGDRGAGSGGTASAGTSSGPSSGGTGGGGAGHPRAPTCTPAP